MIIVGHNYFVKEYLCNNTFSEKLIVAITCDKGCNFRKVKLYIYRVRCDQLHSLARPCRSCMEAIKDLGIRHVYYTTDDGFAYERVCEHSTSVPA